MKKYIIAAAALLLSISAAAQRYGVTNFSVCYLRAEPDYESALETQELMGIVVEIQEAKSYWLKVKSPQPYTAWCTDMGIVEMSKEEIDAYKAAPKYIVTAFHSQVLDQRGNKGQMISDLVQGDILRVGYKTDKKGNSVADIDKKGSAKVVLPDGREGYVPASDLMDLGKWADSRKLNAKNIIATAKEYVGIPYLWGGMSTKGFDCSGFVRTVYLMNGVVLPRNASQQAPLGVEVSDFTKLKAGDLIFFGQKGGLLKKEKITHVGLYIGNGEFIHSSHVVRINSLTEGAENYYKNAPNLIRACRLLSTEEIQDMKVRNREYLPIE